MRPFDLIDCCDIREIARCRRRVPAHLLATRFYGDESSSQANPATLTTSGSSSPLTSGNGASATSGSIALGNGAKYQESGSVDLSNSNLSTTVSAGSNSTVTVGDTGLDNALSDVISSLSNGGTIPISIPGDSSGTTVVPVTEPQPTSSSGLDNVNWTLIGIVGAGFLAAVAVLFLLVEKK